jgi:type I restriction enzyme M protein
MPEKLELEKRLWAIANLLRGSMDASEFKNYMLGFIFYKYLSEKMLNYANRVLKNDGITYDELKDEGLIKILKEDSLKSQGFYLEYENLFQVVYNRDDLIPTLLNIFNSIESGAMGTESEDDFVGLFEDLDLTSPKLGHSMADRNRLISDIMTQLNDITFLDNGSGRDILGDAYEYLIGQFASEAGKKAGEFYTPPEVSTILSKIVSMGRDEIISIYDPTCGSGSLLLKAAKEVKEVYNYYGQELNRTTYNLARMNMLMHNIPYNRFNIANGNTLEDPKHLDKKFDAIVANPPFSAKWSASDKFLNDPRFGTYSKLAPKSKADYAFIQHMVHHLKDSGIMATVFPHGVLFRSGGEAVIREQLIENNYLDSVIGLPANLFYGTGIPAVILVFKKGRTNKDILFIDASDYFEKGKQNRLRDKDITKIVDTYKNRETIDKYSKVVDISEIKENGYNLNIARYVDNFEEEEIIDLDKVQSELKDIDNQLLELDNTINGYLAELGL